MAYTTPHIVFPDLRACMRSLVEKLDADDVHNARFMGYEYLFIYLSLQDDAITAIVDETMSRIESEVAELQGKTVTPSLYVLDRGPSQAVMTGRDDADRS